MKHAFDKAGFDRLRFELKAVAAQFSRDDWIAIHDEATERMLSEGQLPLVRDDHDARADAQPPMPEGQRGAVCEDLAHRADGHPNAGGEANSALPEMARGCVPSARDSVSPMPGEGHADNVPKGHEFRADARQSIAGSGHERLADEGHNGSAASRVPIASGGHLSDASAAKEPLPSAREPSEAYLRALKRDQQQTARILLDVYMTSDGRRWGDICPYEFAGMIRDGKRATAIAAVLGPLNPRQQRTPLRELMTPAMETKAKIEWERADAA